MADKRAYVLDREMALAVRRVVNEHLASFQPPPYSERKNRPQSKPIDDGLSNFAIVTVEAIADGGGIGSAVRLDWDMQPVGSDGEYLEVDPNIEGFDDAKLAEMEIEFKSSDFVDAAVGKRVLLHWHEEIETRIAWEDQKVRGCLVEYDVDAAELECLTAIIVTDVACVDGEIVVTSEAIEYVSGPCP